MLINILWPDESQFSIDKVEMENETIIMSITTTNEKGICPHCQKESESIHSHYQRHPVDLPLAGYAVRLDITVPRFFCDNEDCEATTFADRMSPLIEPYAHRTKRLAFVLGGEAGASLLSIMGMAVSPDTLIRLIRKTPEAEMETPKVLGIDEWAKRKGQSYGTILVDLEKHRAIDLLPERSAELLATWLKEHPGVAVISRDRGAEYIKGATEGAPGALQVADRWHLLNNLKDTLKRMLEGKRATLKAVAESNVTESKVNSINDNTDIALVEPSGKLDLPNPGDAIAPVLALENFVKDTIQREDIPRQLTKAKQEKQARYERRQERYEEVRQLHQQGLSIRKIARGLKLSRPTVRKYIEAETCPMYPEGVTRGSKLAPYMYYIRQRWGEQCHNASQI